MKVHVMAKKDGSKGQGIVKNALGSMRTQKDGRLFAMDLLKRIEEPAHRGEFSAVDTQDDPEEGTFKFPPQSPMIREAFDRIYAADEAARLGFFVVMSEYIGQSVIGHLAEGTLGKWEREGRMREVPLPATPESDPVALYESLMEAKDKGRTPPPEFEAGKAPKQMEGYEEGVEVDRELFTKMVNGATHEEAEAFMNALLRVVSLSAGVSAVQGFGDHLIALMTYKTKKGGGNGG
jgi:hypothetical protein